MGAPKFIDDADPGPKFIDDAHLGQSADSDWGGSTQSDWGEGATLPAKKKRVPINPRTIPISDEESLADYGVSSGPRGFKDIITKNKNPHMDSASAAVVAKLLPYFQKGSFLGDASDTRMGRELTGLTDLPFGVLQAYAHASGQGENYDAINKIREQLIQENRSNETKSQDVLGGDPLRAVGGMLTPLPGGGATKGVAGFAKAAGIGGVLGFLQPNPNVQYDENGNSDYLKQNAKQGLFAGTINAATHGLTRGIANIFGKKTVTPAPGDVRNLGSEIDSRTTKNLQADADFVRSVADNPNLPASGKANQLLGEIDGVVGNNPRILQVSTQVQQLKDKVAKDAAYAARNAARGDGMRASMLRGISAVDDAIAAAKNDLTGKSAGVIKELEHLKRGLQGHEDISDWFKPTAVEGELPRPDVRRSMTATARAESAPGVQAGGGMDNSASPFALEATHKPGGNYTPTYDHLNPAPTSIPYEQMATRQRVPGFPFVDHLNPAPEGPRIEAVDTTLSVLKQRIRDVYKSDPTGKLGVDQAQKIVNAISEDVDSAYTRLGGEAARLAKEANQTNAVYKRKWQNPVLRNIVKETAPDQLPGRLFGKTPDAAVNIKAGMTPAGHEAAQAIMLENIMEKSGGAPDEILKALKSMKGATEVFFEGDAKAKLDGIAKIAQVSQRTAQVGVPLAGVAAGSTFGPVGGFAGAIASKGFKGVQPIKIGAEGMQWLLSTKPGQNWLLKVSTLAPDSPAMAAAISQINTEAALASGIKVRPPWEKPKTDSQGQQ